MTLVTIETLPQFMIELSEKLQQEKQVAVQLSSFPGYTQYQLDSMKKIASEDDEYDWSEDIIKAKKKLQLQRSNLSQFINA